MVGWVHISYCHAIFLCFASWKESLWYKCLWSWFFTVKEKIWYLFKIMYSYNKSKIAPSIEDVLFASTFSLYILSNKFFKSLSYKCLRFPFYCRKQWRLYLISRSYNIAIINLTIGNRYVTEDEWESSYTWVIYLLHKKYLLLSKLSNSPAVPTLNLIPKFSSTRQ